MASNIKAKLLFNCRLYAKLHWRNHYVLNPIYFKIIDGKTVYHSISDKVGIIHKIGTTLLMDFPKYIFLNQYLILMNLFRLSLQYFWFVIQFCKPTCCY